MPDEYEELFAAPVAAPLWSPAPWITTTGPVRWAKMRNRQWARCEDCLHCIADELAGHAPDGVGPAVAPRRATVRRTQGGEAHFVCDEHAEMRKDSENG